MAYIINSRGEKVEVTQRQRQRKPMVQQHTDNRQRMRYNANNTFVETTENIENIPKKMKGVTLCGVGSGLIFIGIILLIVFITSIGRSERTGEEKVKKNSVVGGCGSAIFLAGFVVLMVFFFRNNKK
mgnify:CR=1 FL=1